MIYCARRHCLAAVSHRDVLMQHCLRPIWPCSHLSEYRHQWLQCPESADPLLSPTGLDSSNAAKVVDILAGLAAGGVGVVLTIHQPRPDVFRLMHRVLLLSGRGQVIYILISLQITFQCGADIQQPRPDVFRLMQPHDAAVRPGPGATLVHTLMKLPQIGVCMHSISCSVATFYCQG